MNFQEIEKLRYELSSFLPQINELPKVLVLFSFYEKLTLTKDVNLIDAFAPEFIEEYLTELDSYSPFYSEPIRTEQLLKQLAELKHYSVFGNHLNRIEELIRSINGKLNSLFAVLDGNAGLSEKRNKLLFPLLGKVVTSSETFTYASIEPVTVKVTTAKHKDSFVFIPSNQKKEQLEEQAKISFQLALQYLKEYKHKFHKYHEVLTYFDNLSADYKGNSLGIALTIGFIEQLSTLYNLPYLTNVKDNIASTGGLDKNGNVPMLGDEIIKQKVEAAFYSDLETLIIPKDDETAAKHIYKVLKETYPKRELRLTPVENLIDLLERRNLIDIKKQSSVVRTAKTIKKNPIVAILLMILLLILSFLYLREFDDNPYTYQQTANEFIIRNKYNRDLWSLQNSDYHYKQYNNVEHIFRILDINDDGRNEILFYFPPEHPLTDDNISEGLALLDYKGKIVWKRKFEKYLKSKREDLVPPYSVNIFDTLRIKNQLCILCGSNNIPSYASAVYVLNLNQNKVVSDTLWNPGYIIDVRIVDLNNDNKKELLLYTLNNGYKKISLVYLEFNELKGQTPSTEDYKLFSIQNTKIIHNFLIPKTDYNQYYKSQYTSPWYRGLILRNEYNIVSFVSREGEEGKTDIHPGNLFYYWNYGKNNFDISIDNLMSVRRDSLVVKGELPYPLTDTREFRELMRKQILAWDGKKFIPLDEWRQKRAQK